MYNYFRQGWIVSRLQNSVRAAFGSDALVLNLPSRDTLDPDENLGGAFTMFMAGANQRIRDAFARDTDYWIDPRRRRSTGTRRTASPPMPPARRR